MITIPPTQAAASAVRVYGGCYKHSHCSSSGGLCWNGYQAEQLASRAGSVGGLAPPGHEPRCWLICCTYCTQFSVFPPPGDNPLPPLPAPAPKPHRHSSPTVGSTPQLNLPSLRAVLCCSGQSAFVMWDCNRACPFWFSDVGWPLQLILESPRDSWGPRIFLVTGMIHSNCISTDPSEVGVPQAPHLALSSASMLL